MTLQHSGSCVEGIGGGVGTGAWFVKEKVNEECPVRGMMLEKSGGGTSEINVLFRERQIC